MDGKIKKAATEIVDKIANLPINSEFTFSSYFSVYYLRDMEKFGLFKEVLELCESRGIQIDNTQKGMCLGLPWVYKFKKLN